MDMKTLGILLVCFAFVAGLYFYVDPFLAEHPRFSIEDENTRSTVANFFKLGFTIALLFIILMAYNVVIGT